MKRRRGSQASSGGKAVLPEARASAPSGALSAIFIDYGRPAILALTTALLVSTPLVPSESIVSEGTGAPWHLMWLALALISLLGSALTLEPARRWTWPDLCVGILVGWHLVSAIFADGNQRHAWNAAWQWAAYGALVVVLRQQLVSSLQVRQLVLVMLALALAVSLHSYYQYFVQQPALRAEFAKNPDMILQQLNIPAGTTGPVRALAENRINSVEPIAEFALTNSLAGFLLPWMLVALAVAFWSLQRGDSPKTAVVLVVMALLMAGVLVLTKSRTVWLAALGGCGLILLFGRRSGWRVDWRWPAAVSGAVLVLGLLAVAAKGLDAKVLSEAPKSLLYRVEYWRATAAMIGDNPILGTGPGNFQERYAEHKLPQASETIADPHNFLLEVWSTAGTPALLALLALIFMTAWQLGTQSRTSLSGTSPAASPIPSGDPKPTSVPAEDVPISQFAMLIGAFLGLLLAGLLGYIVFYPLETTRSGFDPNDTSMGVPVVWITGAFALVACYFLVGDWLERGQLPRAALVIALLALLVNLLAAGAAIFPGVVNSAWLLWVLAMRENDGTEDGQAVNNSAAVPSKTQQWITYVMAAIVAVGVVGCYRTEYLPVLTGDALLRDAMDSRLSGQLSQSIDLSEKAVQADPWSSKLRRSLVDAKLGRWLIDPVERNWKPVEAAMADFERSSPHHFGQHQQRGEWLLFASRRIKNNELLTASAEAFAAAIQRYPNNAYLHAQLASVYRELGRPDDARRAAEEALRLDALCPHLEQKLKERKLYDAHWPPTATSPDGNDPNRPSAAEVVADILKPPSKPESVAPAKDAQP